MMARHKKTDDLIQAAYNVLEQLNPMTLRQCYYQLVAGQVIPNCKASYDKLGRALTDARRNNLIPWEWLIDRTRTPHQVPMWYDGDNFLNCVLPQFRIDVWQTQPEYIECWVEKDALSGVFDPITHQYGVTLCVCRGYPSASFLYEASERLGLYPSQTILYFGDFDPSGNDMPRAICEGLADFGCYPRFCRCALNPDDIEQYGLPHDPAKKTDTRSKAHIAKHGDVSVELDALPVNILRSRITTEIEARLNLDELARIRSIEKAERDRMMHLVNINN